MFDTHIAVTGTVLNTPEKRLVTKTNAVVTSFRVASHARRFDKETQQWVDGATFRIRVNCWRRLADNVYSSIHVGDPVVIEGRITTRDWTTEQGEPRITYEIDADHVGHDLARGSAVFTKIKADPFGTVVEDAENRVNGEPTVDFGTEERPSFDDFPYTAAEDDALTILRTAGLDPSEPGDEESDDLTDEEEMAGAGAGSGGSSGRGRRRGRQPVPA